ncbi:MAG: hydrogenase maturation nickel metallochaperone HypA [Phycisphaerales bacterium]|nr:MAG: hydrogenase maturation nickel metallochaperone HypA [Phycisphaerales bacterium]
MHEMTVAQSLIKIISDEAVKQNAKPLGARISCGTLNPINDEALRFAFEAIAKGTPCEDLKIQIEHKPISANCKNCGEVFNVELSHPACPECSGESFELLPDAPLLLEEIDFETE